MQMAPKSKKYPLVISRPTTGCLAGNKVKRHPKLMDLLIFRFLLQVYGMLETSIISY